LIPSIVADKLLTEPAIIGLWKTDPQWRALLGEDFRPGVTHMPGENPDDLDSE
jgi:hypothetical protein